MIVLDPPFGSPLRQDYCWKRVGWHWEVWSFKLNRWGQAVFSERIVPVKFWNWRTAAKVNNAIFCAYLDGKDVGRVEISSPDLVRILNSDGAVPAPEGKS